MPSNASTRDRLVDSARYLFWDRGYAGTSMAELLNHAGVNSGSFYHFFDSKEALLREVLRGYIVMLRPMVVAPAFETTDDPIAAFSLSSPAIGAASCKPEIGMAARWAASRWRSIRRTVPHTT